jgi:hypothetical protein
VGIGKISKSKKDDLSISLSLCIRSRSAIGGSVSGGQGRKVSAFSLLERARERVNR